MTSKNTARYKVVFGFFVSTYPLHQGPDGNISPLANISHNTFKVMFWATPQYTIVNILRNTH